ncbi:hypothetical protein BYT27DRAFT_7181993 [Phlegmacium glaucopus]|nr:hypothetical protein BYT27DRAFT_7181993 [Phlegmacium glaucopus]
MWSIISRITSLPQARGWSIKACRNLCYSFNPLCSQSELGSAVLKTTACPNQFSSIDANKKNLSKPKTLSAGHCREVQCQLLAIETETEGG